MIMANLQLVGNFPAFQDWLYNMPSYIELSVVYIKIFNKVLRIFTNILRLMTASHET